MIHVLKTTLGNRWNLIRAARAGRGFIAHHGIQRSGTNYLNTTLKTLGLLPQNAFDPARNVPHHKHFRWQDDKASIPPFIAAQYSNSLTAETIDELDRQAGFRAGTRHLVIYKHRTNWIVSICNWGLACGWFTHEHEALDSIPVLASDYDAYYGFWSGMAERHPECVGLIEYEAMSYNLNTLLTVLDRIHLRYTIPPGFSGKIDQVPMSPSDRRRKVDLPSVMKRLEG